MRAAIVFNPVKVEREALDSVVQTSTPDGWDETLWFETNADDAGKGAVEKALAEKVDLLIVGGGDGTVRVAAEMASDAGVKLGIIPAGTGNLLARNLGIDVSSHEKAIRTAFDGEERTIDLGELDVEDENGKRSRHVFAVMAGFGLDAEMIDKTDDDLKKKVGWLAYVDAIGKVVGSIGSVRVQVRLDGGRTIRSSVNTLVIGNCGSVQNGIVVLPDAAVDDGVLDIALVRPNGVRGWFQLFGYIARNNMLVTKVMKKTGRLGRQRSGPALGYGQAKETHVRIAEARTVQIDGDIIGKAVALRAGIREQALVVRVPEQRELLGVAV